MSSLYVESVPGVRLHVRHFAPDGARTQPPVLLVHGSVENGRIFYSRSQKGLGPYLARLGFPVYVADLRGRGESTPKTTRGASHGQFEDIAEDLPALARLVLEHGGSSAYFFGAHSWGGVLFASYLSRFPEAARNVRAMAFFGTKRRIAVMNWRKLLAMNLGWDVVAPLLTGLVGYLPASRLGLGSDDETRASHAECKAWVNGAPWRDVRDGFDYAAAATRVPWPPLISVMGKNDHYLGHPDDVRRFVGEMGAHDVTQLLLARSAGRKHDYGHIDMLTHPDAEADHFPEVARYFAERA